MYGDLMTRRQPLAVAGDREGREEWPGGNQVAPRFPAVACYYYCRLPACLLACSSPPCYASYLLAFAIAAAAHNITHIRSRNITPSLRIPGWLSRNKCVVRGFKYKQVMVTKGQTVLAFTTRHDDKNKKYPMY